MLVEYVERAMGKAIYEKLQNGTCCGRFRNARGQLLSVKRFTGVRVNPGRFWKTGYRSRQSMVITCLL